MYTIIIIYEVTTLCHLTTAVRLHCGWLSAVAKKAGKRTLVNKKPATIVWLENDFWSTWNGLIDRLTSFMENQLRELLTQLTDKTTKTALPRKTTSLASQHERGCILDKKPYGGLSFHDSESPSSTGHSRINKQEKINTCFLRASSLLFCSSSFRASIKCCLSSSLYERRFSCKR